MQKRTLGRTGIEVSRIGLGGLFLADWFNDQAGAAALVRRAIETGINYIDTAPTYGNSEEQLGGALRETDAPLVLSTKLGGRPKPFDARDKDALFASFDESLRLLGRSRVDLLLIHEPDRPRQYDWWEDFDSAAGLSSASFSAYSRSRTAALAGRPVQHNPRERPTKHPARSDNGRFP